MFINETTKPFVVELEATFIKALKLLHSKDSTSAAELRQIYEEAIKKNKKDIKKTDLEEAGLKSKNTNYATPDVQPAEKTDTKTSKDTETKKKRKALSSDEDTDISDEDVLPTSLDTDNLLCVICKSVSQSSQNQLVECQECHGLYHQECHKPAITENINDPRLVWYCSRCSKTLSKKIATKPLAKKTKVAVTQPSSYSSSRDSPVLFSKILSSSKSEQPSTQQPFKRIESSKLKDLSSSSSSTTSRGLACLAANLASSNKIKGKLLSGTLSSSPSSNSSSSSNLFKPSKTSKAPITSFSSAISGHLSFASSLNKKN